MRNGADLWGLMHPDRGEQWLLEELTEVPRSVTCTTVLAEGGTGSTCARLHEVSPPLALDSLHLFGSGHLRGIRVFHGDRSRAIREHLVRGAPCLTGAQELALALEPLRVLGPLYLHEVRNIEYRSFIKLRPGFSLPVSAELRLVRCDGDQLVYRAQLLTDVSHARTGQMLEEGRVHWQADIIVGFAPPPALELQLPRPVELRPLEVAHYTAHAAIHYGNRVRSLNRRFIDYSGATWGEVDIPDLAPDQLPVIGDALALTPAFERGRDLMVHVNLRTESIRFAGAIRVGEALRHDRAQTYSAPLVPGDAPNTYVARTMSVLMGGAVAAQVTNATFAAYGWVNTGYEESMRSDA